MILFLIGCDTLLGTNPNHCSRNPAICDRDSACNPETNRCETLDCTINTALCSESQDCIPTTRRCQTRTFVLGQPDVASNLNAAYGMSLPWGALLLPNPQDATRSRLVIGGNAQQRALIWNDVPTQNRPADVVLGMPDVHTLSINLGYSGTDEVSMRSAWSVASDGTRLVVGDYFLNRVLIYSQIPSSSSGLNLIPATNVWGQPSFEDGAANAGQSTAHALGTTSASVCAERAPGNGFYLADLFNHRVLVFAGIPSGSNQAPVSVLGQPDFTSNTSGVAANKMFGPRGVACDGNLLAVADSGAHRVLVFTLPVTTGAPASVVLGQQSFTTALRNGGAAASSATTMNLPSGLWFANDGGPRLFVADTENHRVLRFTLPLSTGQAADLVLGQGDFISNQANRGGTPDASTLNRPTHGSGDGRRLIVTDLANNRALIWSRPLIQNGQPSDVILGQPDPTSNAPNAPPRAHALQLKTPRDVATDGKVLIVADTGNHRVLIWNRLPRSGATPPDIVLGQSDFAGGEINARRTPDAATLSEPRGLSLDGGRLAVADSGNRRVLIWNRIPTQSFVPADLVLGQSGFTTTLAGAGPSGMNEPSGVRFNQDGLYVADTANNRVLRFAAPLATGAAAVQVLGQSSFLGNAVNSGGLSARSLSRPDSVAVSGGKLLVTDGDNQRVLIWNTLPAQDHAPADVVLGQIDFASQYTRPDRLHVRGPANLLVHAGRLYVSSPLYNRVLYWNQIPAQSGARADGVLGQTDFLATLPNNQELPPIERLSAPRALAAAGDQLFIADTLNSRVVVVAIKELSK